MRILMSSSLYSVIGDLNSAHQHSSIVDSSDESHEYESRNNYRVSRSAEFTRAAKMASALDKSKVQRAFNTWCRQNMPHWLIHARMTSAVSSGSLHINHASADASTAIKLTFIFLLSCVHLLEYNWRTYKGLTQRTKSSWHPESPWPASRRPRPADQPQLDS